MKELARGFDLMLSLLAAAIWGFAAFVLVSRFVSDTAGALLGVAVAMSGAAVVLSGQLRETRLESLLRGRCPRCGERVRHEHRHRRWEPETSTWVQPVASWECSSCGFNHSESWDCPDCPDKRSHP